MDDLISRQAAIDAIAQMMPESYTPDGSHPADERIFAAQEIFVDCIKTIEILPSIQPDVPDRNVGKWIPCSERVPVTNETVLITHRCGVSTGWYNGAYWERGASTNHKKLQTVIAWQPLPESYNPKEDT